MRKAIALLNVVGLAFALSSCSTDEAVPEPSAASQTAPAVTETSFENTSATIFGVLTKADKSLDKNELAERATGPFLQMRTQEYALEKLLADAYDIDSLSSDSQVFAATSNQSFPRWIYTVMEAPEGTNLKTITVFEQASSRENWKVWAVLPILPGQTVPGLKLSQGSAVAVAADSSDGLVASPSDVVAAYATYNSERKQGDISFGDDALYTSLSKLRDANSKALDDAGSATMSFQVSKDNEPVAFRTDDGGALVVAQMDFSTTISVTKEGATLKVGSTIGALATGDANGEVEVSGKLVANYSVMVAFHVPATSSSKVQVVGASDPLLLSVKNG